MIRNLPPLTPITARHLLPLTWSIVSEHPSSVVVSVSIPTESGSCLMTSEVEVVRDSWEPGYVDGPSVEPTDLELLCEDVARWAEGRGARWEVA
ncbi:MAG: hypothetical protein AB7E70_19620 [Hyphomicrobiaceae bacterium]